MPKYMKAKKPRALNVDAMRNAVINFMEQQGVEIKKEFLTTTATWRHEVQFTPELESPGNDLDGVFSMDVGTEDELYRLVNGGAKAHWEEPVNVKSLKFPRAHLPKSIPGLIRANPGYRSNYFYFSKGHEHPGFPARNFDKAIKEDYEPKFAKAVKNQLMKTLRQVSGNKI